MTDRPEHNSRPENGTPSAAPTPAARTPGDYAYEEALDAAKVFGELAEEEPTVETAARPAERGRAGDVAETSEPARDDAARYEDAAFADDFDLRRSVARAEAALDAAEATLIDRTPLDEAKPAAAVVKSPPAAAPAAPPERQSIGRLFTTVVKHSPPSRIRIESNSIGALFRRFIDQE